MFIKRWLGIALLFIGVVLFLLNPVLNLTGYSIAEKFIIKEVWFFAFGIGFIIIGIILAKARIPVPAGLKDIVTEVGPFEATPHVFVDTSTIIGIRRAIKESGQDPSRVDFLGANVSGNYEYFIPEHGLREMHGLSRPTSSRGYSPHGKQTIEQEAFRYISSYLPQKQKRAGGVTVEVKKNPRLTFVDDVRLKTYEGKVEAAIDSYRNDPKTRRRIDDAEKARFLRGADAKLIAGAIMSREYGNSAVVLTEDSLVREVVHYLNKTRKSNEPEIKAYGVGDWQRRRGYV